MYKILAAATMTAVLAMPFAQAAETNNTANTNAAAVPATEYKSKAPKLNRAELDALLAKPQELLVIDVRRPDEITANGGLPVYLSIQAKELERSLAFIPKERSIVVISNHAGRAGPAADLLLANGFKVAGIAGVLNYQEEGGTLTKIAPPAPKAAAAEQR